MTKTQKDRVLDHLKEQGTITSWEAIQNYGITRLSEYIRQLRLDVNVNTKMYKKGNLFMNKKRNEIVHLI